MSQEQHLNKQHQQLGEKSMNGVSNLRPQPPKAPEQPCKPPETQTENPETQNSSGK